MFVVSGVAGSAFIPTPEPVVFNADHPFLYYLKDAQSDIILFVGRFLIVEWKSCMPINVNNSKMYRLFYLGET